MTKFLLEPKVWKIILWNFLIRGLTDRLLSLGARDVNVGKLSFSLPNEAPGTSILFLDGYNFPENQTHHC